MRPADLEDFVKFHRLPFQRFRQTIQRRNQAFPDRHRRGDVDSGGKRIVGGLPEVHVIVRVNPQGGIELAAAVGDHLVHIHVRRGAGTCLIDINRKLRVMVTVHDFGCDFGNQPRHRGLQQSKFAVGFRRGFFDETIRVDEFRGQDRARDREIENRPLRRRAVERIRRDFHFSHGVFLDPCFFHLSYFRP